VCESNIGRFPRVSEICSKKYNMFFNLKKLLSNAIDLTPWQRGRRNGKSGMRAGFVDLCCRKKFPSAYGSTLISTKSF
jgi:hypothetical protein